MRLRIAGFTLIELMVAVAVLAILAVLAVPTFQDFRQRIALRGAADQLVSVWGDARFEALRRNQLVKVGLKTTSAGAFCVGVATATAADDDTACNCFSAGACNISAYPATQSDWRGVTSVGQPTLGNLSDSDDDGVAVIDPKRGVLAEYGDVGGIALKGPAGQSDYRLRMEIDRNGRAVLCEPPEAPAHLPQFTNRSCPAAP